MFVSASVESTSSTPRGFEKCWFADGRVLCYRFDNTERATVDACADDLRGTLSSWPAAKPCLLLLDLQGRGVFVSAYVMHRAREFVGGPHPASGRLALVVPNGANAHVISLALNGLKRGRDHRALFPSTEAAIAWLLQSDTISAA